MSVDISVRKFASSDAESVIALWSDALPSSQPWNEPRTIICRKLLERKRRVSHGDDAFPVHGATLVGIDSLNIDDTHDRRRPVHSTLLATDIPIVEHLTNLAVLPETGSRFFAVPVKVKAFGTFPVRAFAKVEKR